MTDYCMTCAISDLSTLQAALIGFPNIIGPKAGDGSIGDPTKIYVNVRVLPNAASAPVWPGSAVITDTPTSTLVLGIWA